MRVTGTALTGMILAIGGFVAVGASDVAFAKAPSCKGKNQALQNGECVTITGENPNHVFSNAMTGPQLYRSSTTSHRHHKPKTQTAPAS